MKYPLMKAFGLELEYMVVDQNTFDILPIVDKIFEKINGKFTNEIHHGKMDWSNELVAHVIELKNPKPTATITELNLAFQKEIKLINQTLQEYNAILLPTSMHPWMNPDTESVLWPHENNEIYSTYDKLFGCSGHGWSNLQSMHINLAFSNDQEFEKLHAAVRLILPLIPALSSSSPIFENKKGEALSSRLTFYLKNQKKIPSIIGPVIPEQAWSKKEYEDKILNPMYKDIAPYDTDKVLQEEWLNSRAAIPKFERDSIEIRLADTNENAFIDVAIALFWTKTLKSLINENFITLQKQKEFNEYDLKEILVSTIQAGSKTKIINKDYLNLWGLNQGATAYEVLNLILSKLDYNSDEIKYKEPIEYIIKNGTLSERILKMANNDFSKTNLIPIYKKLSKCLEEVKTFEV